MRIALLLAVATVTISSFPFGALQEDSAAQQSATATAVATAVDQSAKVNAQTGAEEVQSSRSASAEVYLRPVNGELVGNLDAKTARSGDSVAVMTEENVRAADGTIIPSGSHLIGLVTDVEAHGWGHAGSSLSIAFDRAQLKSGHSLAIHFVIQSVAPPVRKVAAASIGVDGGVHGSAGTVDSLSALATATPGVLLAGTASGSTSGTFFSPKKNVHLDSGTQMILAVSTAAAN